MKEFQSLRFVPLCDQDSAHQDLTSTTKYYMLRVRDGQHLFTKFVCLFIAGFLKQDSGGLKQGRANSCAAAQASPNAGLFLVVRFRMRKFARILIYACPIWIGT
jgi:hypothetical protein